MAAERDVGTPLAAVLGDGAGGSPDPRPRWGSGRVALGRDTESQAIGEMVYEGLRRGFGKSIAMAGPLASFA